MSRIYIAAPLHEIEAARALAACLTEVKHHVVSSWHAGSPTVESESGMSGLDCRALGDTCLREIDSADALVFLYGPETSRHGSVFEAGVAYGNGVDVYAVGIGSLAVLPTILLRASRIHHCDLSDIVEALRGDE